MSKLKAINGHARISRGSLITGLQANIIIDALSGQVVSTVTGSKVLFPVRPIWEMSCFK